MTKITFLLKGASIAQWICLHIPSCRPGFDSQDSICTFIIYSQFCAIFVLVMLEKNENKQKEVGFGPFKNILVD